MKKTSLGLVNVHPKLDAVNYTKGTSFCEKVIPPKRKEDFILLIMNCQKYRWKAEKQTWLKGLNMCYYHVLGDTTLSSNYQWDELNHLLYVKVEDDYNSLPQKVIRAYEAVEESFDYQYIFKTDDDQELIRPHFFSTLCTLLRKKKKEKLESHYGGNIIDIKENYLSQYHRIHPELPPFIPMLTCRYCTGRFYFLSKQAIHLLLSKKNKKMIEEHCIEDYIIGYCLFQYPQIIPLQITTHIIFKDMT